MQIKFLAFETFDADDKLTINDESDRGEMVYYGKTIPTDFTLRNSTGNRIYLHWKTDGSDHKSGFKLFYYCFTDNVVHSKQYLQSVSIHSENIFTRGIISQAVVKY